jgi:glycosyltransferase involved in cell wall biosynthesis
MDKVTIIVDASNVNAGGGLVLLNGLLEAELSSQFEVIFFVDSQAKIGPVNRANKIHVVAPTMLARLSCKMEIARLARATSPGSIVVNFGNFANCFWRGRQVTYLHNYFLIGRDWKKSVRPAARNRFRLRRAVFRVLDKISNSNYLVQTKTMAREAGIVLGSARIGVMPVMSFSHLGHAAQDSPPSKRLPQSFCYISLGGENKNHLALIKAWLILAKEGHHPKLTITLEDDLDKGLYGGEVRRLIEENSLNVVNVGKVGLEEVANIYSTSQALIYPSFTESFGLALIEADYVGLDILAADRPYVHDMVKPVQVFDPENPENIAASVLKYLAGDRLKDRGGGKTMLEQVVTPDRFLEKCYLGFKAEVLAA